MLMKTVTGDWFTTTLALNNTNNQMTWLKQDGKSLNQYGIVSPVEVTARVGQSKKFCFEVLNPTTKRSFIYSTANDNEQAKWIAAFNQVLKTPGKEAAPAAPAALPAIVPPAAEPQPSSLLRRHASSSSAVVAESRPAASSSVSETRPAASSSVSETTLPAARPAASSSVSESTATLVSKKSSMFDNKEAPATGSNCVVCNSAVYKMEEVIVDRMMMHKQCFQCEHCKRQLTMGNFACINGNMFYCKPHYFEVFSQSGGKYEKAFGDAGFEKKALNSFTPGG